MSSKAQWWRMPVTAPSGPTSTSLRMVIQTCGCAKAGAAIAMKAAARSNRKIMQSPYFARTPCARRHYNTGVWGGIEAAAAQLTRALHRAFALERTASVRELDLHGRMADLETMVQLVGDVLQEIVARMALRRDQMARQRRLLGAHRPDVQVVHALHLRQGGQILTNVMRVDLTRRGVEREPDRFAQQTPGAPQDHDRDQEACHRVEPLPAGQHDAAGGSDDGDRDAGIAEHVQEGAAHIDVGLAAAAQEPGGQAVDDDGE